MEAQQLNPKRVSILIADDDRLYLAVTSRQLARENDFAVIGTALDGAEAVNKVAALHPDLLLLDYQMPNVDGLVALSEIRQRKLPLRVVLSSSEDVQTEALHRGADAFFKKGQAFSALAELIKNLCGPSPAIAVA